MATDRIAEWVTSGGLRSYPADSYSYGFDIGQGTLLRLIYRMAYGSASDPVSPYESISFRVVWALQPTAPDPLAAGVDPPGVLDRDEVTGFMASAATTARSELPNLWKDIEVPRTIEPGDLLYVGMKNNGGTATWWWSFQFRALVLRPEGASPTLALDPEISGSASA